MMKPPGMIDRTTEPAPIQIGRDLDVAIVVTTYNHAHFLADAIESCLSQTVQPAEIIVVDDGSADDPAAVAGRFPGIVLICQDNQGLAVARNTGLRAARSSYILFLDADDRLLPGAIETGLACFAVNADAGFVYGGHRRVAADGSAIGADRYDAIGQAPFADLLQGNLVAMHATALYDRLKLLEIGGYDPGLRRCEDYDVYLRMSRLFPVASHPEIIAEYRWHDANMSHRQGDMLKTVLAVHERQKGLAMQDPATAAAWQAGRRNWRDYYAWEMLRASLQRDASRRGTAIDMGGIVRAMALSPQNLSRKLAKSAARHLVRALPEPVGYRVKRMFGRDVSPPVGSVDFGDFDRLKPVSPDFGFDRGLPIDRYYIENFLQQNAGLIAGRVLEVGGDAYSRRFGGARITHQDVLHIHADAPGATIIGDMAEPDILPDGVFDCLVLTQTLHLIYDMDAAVRSMLKALKPGGVALVTVPGITPVDRGVWKETWYWSLTRYAATRLFGDVFGAENVAITSHGNAFAATAWIQGVALQEVMKSKLDPIDDSFPIVVTVVARKPVA